MAVVTFAALLCPLQAQSPQFAAQLMTDPLGQNRAPCARSSGGELGWQRGAAQSRISPHSPSQHFHLFFFFLDAIL